MGATAVLKANRWMVPQLLSRLGLISWSGAGMVQCV
jgi:hypothetical protein